MTGSLISRLLKQALTESDNETYEVAALLGFFGILVFLSLSIVNWREFKPEEWGIGFGSAIAGMGAAIGLKSRADRPKEQ